MGDEHGFPSFLEDLLLGQVFQAFRLESKHLHILKEFHKNYCFLNIGINLHIMEIKISFLNKNAIFFSDFLEFNLMIPRIFL